MKSNKKFQKDSKFYHNSKLLYADFSPCNEILTLLRITNC